MSKRKSTKVGKRDNRAKDVEIFDEETLRNVEALKDDKKRKISQNLISHNYVEITVGAGRGSEKSYMVKRWSHMEQLAEAQTYLYIWQSSLQAAQLKGLQMMQVDNDIASMNNSDVEAIASSYVPLSEAADDFVSTMIDSRFNNEYVLEQEVERFINKSKVLGLKSDPDDGKFMGVEDFDNVLDLHEVFHEVCRVNFLPDLARNLLQTALSTSG